MHTSFAFYETVIRQTTFIRAHVLWDVLLSEDQIQTWQSSNWSSKGRAKNSEAFRT